MAGLAGPKATSFSVVPSAPIELGQIAGQIPVDLAERQAKIAQAQADAATARATRETAEESSSIGLQSQRDALKASQLKDAHDRLAQLAPMAANNPQFAGSPAVKNVVQGLFDTLGVSVPTDAAGNIDWQTVQSAVAAPMTATGVQHVLDDVDKTVKLFEDPKSGMSPGQFAASMKQKYDLFTKTGNIPEAQSLLSYINPDGTPTAAYSERVVSAWTAAQIGNLESLGVERKDSQALRDQIADEKRREFNVTQRRLGSEFQQKIGVDYARIKQQADALRVHEQDAQTRIGISLQNLNLAQQRFTQSSSMNDLHAYKYLADDASGQLDKWQTELDGVVSNLRQMTTSQLASPEGQALTQSAKDLQTLIQTNRPLVAAQQNAAHYGLGQAVQSITGNTTVVPPPHGLPADFAASWRNASPADRKATLADKRLTKEQRAYIQSLPQ